MQKRRDYTSIKLGGKRYLLGCAFYMQTFLFFNDAIFAKCGIYIPGPDAPWQMRRRIILTVETRNITQFHQA